MKTMVDSVAIREPILQVTDVKKSFGGVHALKSVSMTVRPGTVHGLIGANGAGKSTLIKCLAGVEHPDSGQFFVDGKAVSIETPDDASTLGLAFIHQEMSLIPGWDVLRNMALGSSPTTRVGIIDWRPTRAQARQVATRLGMNFSLDTPVDSLSTADQWLVLIGRALMHEARLIAMDEPTASLSSKEAGRLHDIIRDLVAGGTTVIFISHRLEEVSALCDDITVFKDGSVTREAVGESISKASLVSAIVGHDIVIQEHGSIAREPGPAILEVKHLTTRDLLRDVSLTLHEGEILGLGGLVGAGRSELVHVIYGASRAKEGTVTLDGKKVAFQHPADAVAAGLGLVPEERRAEGLFLENSISFNINLPKLSSLRYSRFNPLLNLRSARKRAQQVADLVTVKANNVRTVVEKLSGGNQQKVLLARWLLDQPRILILDEPSRGVDVGARAEIHGVIRDLADRGTAVVVVSSDNEELVSLAHRVIVLAEGRITGQLQGESITEEAILRLSFARNTEEGTS